MSNQTRAPYQRVTNGEPEDLAMNLPEGKTCGDCVHCNRCTAIFGHIPEDQVCDWYPSRYREKATGAPA